MENGMKSIDDIAMAAVNAYFQINADKTSTMGYDEVAAMYAHAYLESRKIVKKVFDEEKLRLANRAEQALDGSSGLERHFK